MGDIPGALDDITPSWLNEHVDLGGSVGDVRATRIGEGYGMISTIGRVELDYSSGSGPASVVVKLPSAIPDLVAMSQMYGFYDREVSFYARAAGDLPNVPRCHHAQIDDTGGRFVLVIEDMGHLRMADQVAGCTADDARLAVDAMADLHARFWENDALEAQTWLPAANNPLYQQAEEQYQQVYPAFLEKYGEGLSDDALTVADGLRTRIKRFQDLGATEPPQTLAHFDLRLDNLMFGDDQVYLLDWQLSVRTIGAIDLAYFVGWSMTDELRRSMTDELITRYHDRITGHGVAGYSRDQLEEHVRRSMLGVAMMAAYGSVAVPATNERGQALLDAMVDRTFSAIDDLGSVTYLDDL